jgi:hypothetical protein
MLFTPPKAKFTTEKRSGAQDFDDYGGQGKSTIFV